MEDGGGEGLTTFWCFRCYTEVWGHNSLRPETLSSYGLLFMWHSMTNNKNKRKSHKTPSPLGSITKGVDILLEGETGKAQRLPLGKIISFVLPHLNFFGRKHKPPHATQGPKVLGLKPNLNRRPGVAHHREHQQTLPHGSCPHHLPFDDL